MFRTLKLFIILFISIFFIAKAQDDTTKVVYAQGPYEQRPSYGLFFDLNYNLHSGNFTGEEWEGIPNCCPRFEKGGGIGFSAGLFYTLPVLYNWDLNIRVGVFDLSGLLSYDEDIKVPDINGEAEDGVFEHTIDASIMSAGIMPLMSFHATDNILINLGFRAGYIFTKSFSQKEEIKEPSWGTFEDTGTRTRHEFSGDIPNASALDFAGVAGIGYSLPLNSSKEWFLEPEIYYILGIMPLASNLKWNVNNIIGGVAIKYAPREIIPPVIPPKEAPMPPLPPPPQPPKFNAYITAVSVEPDGSESAVSKIRVEEYLSRRIHPLLNFVFFDDGSAEIPLRYSRMSDEQKAEFSPNFLANLKTMQVYHQVLNIVGNRMKRNPNTTLKLIGCNSNQGVERGNTNLSRQRAENVKNFVVSEWNIDAERISIEAKNLPDVPSNPTRKEGLEENRRVEFKSDYNEILFEPVLVRDTIRETNPPLLRFKPRVVSDVGVKSWKVVTYQGDNLLKVFEGKGQPPAILELNLQEEQEYVPLLNEDFKYKLVVIDNDNKSWESEVQSLKVEPYTIQNKFLAMMDGEEVDARDFDRFSLISFEFNKAELTEEHMPIVEMAKERILENSIVEIEGRTDNTGDPQRNLLLSKERADVTAEALGVDKKYAKGIGIENPFYSNEFPEGRFYNRTVYISIETRIEWVE
jgi:outer membrane protein OmpA-like peptidoglycan-associated protein